MKNNSWIVYIRGRQPFPYEKNLPFHIWNIYESYMKFHYTSYYFIPISYMNHYEVFTGISTNHICFIYELHSVFIKISYMFHTWNFLQSCTSCTKVVRNFIKLCINSYTKFHTIFLIFSYSFTIILTLQAWIPNYYILNTQQIPRQGYNEITCFQWLTCILLTQNERNG